MNLNNKLSRLIAAKFESNINNHAYLNLFSVQECRLVLPAPNRVDCRLS